MTFKKKCKCFSSYNSSMHALNWKTCCGCEPFCFLPPLSFCYLIARKNFCVHSVTIETRKWLYKRNSYLNFYSHSVKMLIGKCSYLTPALNTIRDRHTRESLMKEIGLMSSVRKFMFACNSINRNIIFFWTLNSYVGPFPLYGPK